LGLSICKKIANKLGGDIGVISKYGEGSSFFFTFQFSNPPSNSNVETKDISRPLIEKKLNDIQISSANENISPMNNRNEKRESFSNENPILDENSLGKIAPNEKIQMIPNEALVSPRKNLKIPLQFDSKIGETNFSNNIQAFGNVSTNKRKIITIFNQGREVFDYFHEVKEELPKIMTAKEESKQINDQARETDLNNNIIGRKKLCLENEEYFQQGKGLQLFSPYKKFKPKFETRQADKLTFALNKNELSIKNSINPLALHMFEEEKQKDDENMAKNSRMHDFDLKEQNSWLKEFQKDANMILQAQNHPGNDLKISKKLKNSSGLTPIISKKINNNNQIENPKSVFITKGTNDYQIQMVEGKNSDLINPKEEEDLKQKQKINSTNNNQNNDNIECLTNRKLVDKCEFTQPDTCYVSKKPKQDCQCSFILIVDDQAFNRAPLVSFCKRQNLRFEEASDGEKAFAKAKKKTESNCCRVFGFIFLDFNMPGINGVQAAEKIRNLENSLYLQHSRIIGLSGNIEDFDNYNAELSNQLFWAKSQKPIDAFTFNEFIYGETFVNDSKDLQ